MSKKQWSESAVQCFMTSLSLSTWLTYSKYFQKFVCFVLGKGFDVMSSKCVVPQQIIVDFLLNVSGTSKRPKSELNTSVTVVQNYFRAKVCIHL